MFRIFRNSGNFNLPVSFEQRHCGLVAESAGNLSVVGGVADSDVCIIMYSSSTSVVLKRVRCVLRNAETNFIELVISVAVEVLWTFP